MHLSPARGRGRVRGLRTSIPPPHLASPPRGGEEHEDGDVIDFSPYFRLTDVRSTPPKGELMMSGYRRSDTAT